MSEHLKLLGRRQELDMQRKSLEIRIRGLISNLRDALDPLEQICNLRTSEILEWASELAELRDRHSETVSALNQIKDILGR